MAGTLMSFSLLIIDAWKKMGIEFTAEDDIAWLHLWKVVGHIMGVDESLLPVDVPDAQALWDAIARAQWAPSDPGRTLAAALLTVSDRYLPHFPFMQLPATLMRFFCGDVCGDILALPPADWTASLLAAMTRLDALGGDPDQASRIRSLLQLVAYDLMKALVLVKRAGKETRFRIPPALLHAWNLKD
jgi:hypothetical protein